MIETVVHVTTLEQWKSVLDVWFEQGYTWQARDKLYSEFIFRNGAHYLHLNRYISYSLSEPKEFIEYEDFIKEQEKTMAKETYYVTQEQLDLINELKSDNTPIIKLFIDAKSQIKKTIFTIPFAINIQIPVMRYIGGDPSIEFKAR